MKYEKEYKQWIKIVNETSRMMHSCDALLATFNEMEHAPIFNGGTWDWKKDIEAIKTNLMDMFDLAHDDAEIIGDTE